MQGHHDLTNLAKVLTKFVRAFTQIDKCIRTTSVLVQVPGWMNEA